MRKVAFFGLGNMGASMAVNLLKAGHDVTVFDLVQSQVDKLVKQGAKPARTATEAVDNSDVVVSMLPAGKHVKHLYKEILSQVQKQTLFIDCSTIDAKDARELHQQVVEAGHLFVDAPVSGGVAGAAAGTLTFIMGGEKDAVEQAQVVLKAMGKHCFHAGGAGAGQIAKICNNMLLAILMAGTSEALKLGMDNGLDPKTMSEIMKQSSGNNWALQVYNPVPDVMPNVPSSNHYEGGFMVDLMNKDLNLAINAANQSGSITPMGSLAKSLFQLHALKGYGKKDFSSIFESYTHEKQS